MKKHEQLYKSWRELVLLKTKMGEAVLEICGHPEATHEDVAKAVAKYCAVVQMLRKHKPTMLDALKNYPLMHHSVNHLKI